LDISATIWRLVRRRRLLVTLAILTLPRLVLAQAEEVRYFHSDVIGSVRLVTDANGQVVERYDYLPFGDPSTASPTGTETRRFGGKERNAETGLDYFGARYYSSQTGRFTSVDPVLDMKGALIDPQQWNRYTYVRNNPMRYVDPDGRCSKPADQKEGETGVCIEAFIADNWFRGIARGDNRRFSGADSKLTARSRVKVTVSAPVTSHWCPAARPPQPSHRGESTVTRRQVA
jgi:RHS repeat-associated protein